MAKLSTPKYRWIDNADSYICPICHMEVNNPNKLPGRACPRCGFVEIRDSQPRVGLRPCLVHSEKRTTKALFHCWCNEAYIVPPSLHVCGHNGGQVWNTFGVVEMEDGMIKEVPPYSIQFLDPPHKEYAWQNIPDSE